MSFPTYLESLDMVTWCSGLGSRWAERRVDLVGAGRGSISSATLWVHLESESLRTVPPGSAFHEVFSASTQGRTISSKLMLAAAPPIGIEFAPWHARFTDFDVMNHMNNAIAFVIVEEVLAGNRHLRAPLRVEVEYRAPVDPGVALHVGGRTAVGGDDGYDGWLIDDHDRCLIAFRVARPPTPHP
jgi:acyl-ACP thioesterase